MKALRCASVFVVSVLTVLYATPARSQTDPLLTSDLPIVIIDTYGQDIPDDPKITAFMGIIDHGPGVRNALTDSANVYRGYIGIEIRGFTSQEFPKLQYGIELRDSTGTDVSVGLLGMSSDADWVLSAAYNDKTLMRNALAYTLARRTGRYASQGRFCEVVLNGQYWGVYVLFEKLKRDKNRINVTKMATTDISGDKVTGGYVLQIDRPGLDSTEYWQSPYLPPLEKVEPITYLHVYPKTADLVPEQREYIRSYITAFEAAMADSVTYADSTVGFPKYLDLSSAIDFFLVNEASRNIDAYRLSTYLYKERDSKGGKLRVGPVWDFDLGFGNTWWNEGADTVGWDLTVNPELLMRDPAEYQIPPWWIRLSQYPPFWYAAQERWAALRQGPLATSAVMAYIDSVANALQEAQTRNFVRWPILDVDVLSNPYIGGSYENEVAYLKTWTAGRLAWMDAALPHRPNDSLVVILDSLAGRVEDSIVTVSWSTQRERHTMRFEVQRRFVDSLAGNTHWHLLDTLQAADSSEVPVPYVVRDTVLGPAHVWYRVRTVGLNGQQRFSDSVHVFVPDVLFPLTVAMDSLQASVVDSIVTVAWRTTQERYTARFDVQWRSAEPGASDTLWQFTDSVKAADSSIVPLHYTVRDTVVGPKHVAYRVRTIGLKGHDTLSVALPVFVPDSRKTLVVVLDAVTATATDSVVSVAWSTSRETYVRSFTVQRRQADSLAADTLWHGVRTIAGADTSTVTKPYLARDTVRGPADLLYRVVVEGYAGQRQFSSVRSVHVQSPDDTLRASIRSFIGSYGNKGVDLSWSVAGQTNILGFVIERKHVSPPSADSTWKALDTLQATGTVRDTVLYSFTDSIRATGRYVYRVCVTGPRSQSITSAELPMDLTGAALAGAVIPTSYALYQNYPNPFNPSTSIRFDLPRSSTVSIIVYSAIGQRIAVLVDGERPAGRHEVRFDAAGLPSGVYIFSMRAGEFVQHRKLMLLR